MRLATDLTRQPELVPVVPLLQPFLPQSPEAGPTPWDHRFDDYARVAHDHYEVVDLAGGALSEADLVVIPTDWYWVRGPSWASRPDRSLAGAMRDLARRARDAGVPSIAFFSGDRSCDRVRLPGTVMLREGAYRSRSGPRDLPYPAFAEDLVDAYCDGALVERPFSAEPVVGFCGLATRHRGPTTVARLAAYHLTVALRERRRHPSPYIGEHLRLDALAVLERSSLVRTNFVLRDSSVFFRDADTRDLVDVRRVYVDNLIESDYVVCIRGSGNYSYRLYETLCTGRIPIVVDTDLAVPWRDELPWHDLCVWASPADLPDLDRVVRAFHDRLTPDGFVERQHAARRMWKEWLSPEGFLPRVGARVLA